MYLDRALFRVLAYYDNRVDLIWVELGDLTDQKKEQLFVRAAAAAIKGHTNLEGMATARGPGGAYINVPFELHERTMRMFRATLELELAEYEAAERAIAASNGSSKCPN